MFWIIYVLICLCELCLDVVFSIEYFLFHQTYPVYIIISTVVLFIMYIFCFPLIILTVRGYGLVTGVPSTKTIDKLAYIPSLVSFLIICILILIPWGKILRLFH